MSVPDCGFHKNINDIIGKWGLDTHDFDSTVMRHIESALFEAYMSGCCSGGMDSLEFKRGLDFFQEIDKLQK